MLDVFSCPVSALMKLLHDLLGLVVDPGSGAGWAGAVVLLVVCVRLLLRPAWQQLETARRTAALRPGLAALREQHADDPAAHREAVRQRQAAEGPGLAGSLPLLLQLPVFLGLYHLLAGFTLAGAAGGNGVFGPEEVRSFATATLAGVPLSAAVRTPAATLAQTAPGLDPAAVLALVGPLLLVAAAAAFLGGLLLPVPLALVLYWAVNGTWSTAQTWLLTRRLDRRAGPAPAV